MSAALPQPMIGTGEVRHARLRPAANRFVYPTYFLMLPMRRLRAMPSPALARNRFGLISFADHDHGDGRADSLAWLEEQLRREGVADADGEVWLHCYPRVLGFAFKPVSFWYCHRADGSLTAVLVEVNNTFGERHGYLLRDARFGQTLRADKVFHVSPFCSVSGDYRFQFMTTGLRPAGTAGTARTVARIEHFDAAGLVIRTSVSGRLQPLSPARVRAAFFGMPLLTVFVILRIHWQALRLWAKRVPFRSKPAPPAEFITR